MSISLRDFLKQKAVQYAIEREKNERVLEEWRGAVDRLFKQLEEWLRVADPEGVIQVERGETQAFESGFGRYPIARLNLKAFGKCVSLIPKARRVGKSPPPPQYGASTDATGRVDMTDDFHRYLLFRFGQGAEERWFVDKGALDSEMVPLTAAFFEAALLGYLR